MLSIVKNLFSKKQNPVAETAPKATPIGNVWSPETRAQMQKIYTDAAGRDYYAFKNPMDMPWKRAVEADAATTRAEFGITTERLKQALTEIKKANNAGDKNAVGWWAVELETDMQLCAKEETLFSLATTYVFDENEPPASYSHALANDKIQRWKADDEATSFFLGFAWTLTKQYDTMSELDLDTYLRKTKELKRRFQASAPPSIIIFPN
jgi:predicted porin